MVTLSYGQAAQLVFNGGGAGSPFIVFDTAGVSTKTTYLVIDNPAANAIVQTPANSGNIKSEHENNRVRWRTYGTAAGTSYVVPFTTGGGVQMPLTVTKQTVGSGPAGNDSLSFVFATFNQRAFSLGAGVQWDNNQYKPVGVTHMNDFATGLSNNSANAVDRFWIIDPQQSGYAYTTNPNITMQFKYDVAEVSAGNASNGGITAATPLGAQRFNQPAQKWGDMMPQSTGPFVAGTVNVGTAIVGTNFYRSWTLASIADPLPIELTSWSGACDGKQVKLEWSTASEHHNDHFYIEKSRDGVVWTEIGRVEAVGNSSSSTSYNFVDQNVDGLAYYRLYQVNTDGTSQAFHVVAAGCEADETEIVNAWDDGTDVNVVVSSTDAGVYDLTLTDAQGKVMLTRPAQNILKGYTPLKLSKAGISTGVYVIALQNTNDVMTRRVMLY